MRSWSQDALCVKCAVGWACGVRLRRYMRDAVATKYRRQGASLTDFSFVGYRTRKLCTDKMFEASEHPVLQPSWRRTGVASVTVALGWSVQQDLISPRRQHHQSCEDLHRPFFLSNLHLIRAKPILSQIGVFLLFYVFDVSLGKQERSVVLTHLASLSSA